MSRVRGWMVMASDTTWAAWAKHNCAGGKRQPAYEAEMLRRKRDAELRSTSLNLWTAFEQGRTGQALACDARPEPAR